MLFRWSVSPWRPSSSYRRKRSSMTSASPAGAAGLGAVVAEDGAPVPEADRLGLVVHAVLQVGATDGGRALRSPGGLLGAAGLEAVHLLLDDVRRLADAAREQRRLLEHGRLDALVAEEGADSGGRLPDAVPVWLGLGGGIGGGPGGPV